MYPTSNFTFLNYLSLIIKESHDCLLNGNDCFGKIKENKPMPNEPVMS